MGLKYPLDYLIWSGIIPDDSPKYIEKIELLQFKDKNKRFELVLL